MMARKQPQLVQWLSGSLQQHVFDWSLAYE